MNLIKVTKIDQIKPNDTLIITGDTLKNEPIKAHIVKVSADGTEIIFDKHQNRYFNLGMYLNGKSWVKELSIVASIQTKEERIKIINQIINCIALTGRNFFKGADEVAFIYQKGNKLYMRNEYNGSEMCLNTKYGYPPMKWHHGGTLWGLVKDFKDYIYKGGDTNHNNGYGGLNCPHWGYSPEEMHTIQSYAYKLGYLQTAPKSI